MKPLVLVHGAGGGGWCWDAVAPALREAGHEVRTPDLELRDAETTVEDHARQVVAAIDDLTDVVLVGHSYGGMPIAVAADRVPERLARVVYLDAFAPRDGDCAWTERPDLERFMTSHARDGLIPPIPPQYVGADPEHYERLRERLTTTPLRCLAEPVRLVGVGESVARTYVWCTQSGFAPVAERVRATPGWDYREVDTKHMAMLTAPREVAALLLELAA
ncbi:MAG: alpha/beta fold hydrolase [Gaiellaceae bacterium]